MLLALASGHKSVLVAQDRLSHTVGIRQEGSSSLNSLLFDAVCTSTKTRHWSCNCADVVWDAEGRLVRTLQT